MFEELALEDLRRAADLVRPNFDAAARVDGWVSMEVSPLLANDTARAGVRRRAVCGPANRAKNGLQTSVDN